MGIENLPPPPKKKKKKKKRGKKRKRKKDTTTKRKKERRNNSKQNKTTNKQKLKKKKQKQNPSLSLYFQTDKLIFGRVDVNILVRSVIITPSSLKNKMDREKDKPTQV